MNKRANTRPGLTLGDIQPDLLLYIADIVGKDHWGFPQEAFFNLSLINKHWERHMKLHPLASTATFHVDCSSVGYSLRARSTNQHVRRWLCQPHRKNRLIRNLFIELATEAEYDEFCDMLDKEYADTVFDRIEIKTVVLERTPTEDYNEDDEDWEPWIPSPTIILPSSLKARHLLLNDDCDTAKCVSKSLTPTPDLVFKSLKKLWLCFDSKQDLHYLQKFISSHSKITDLDLLAYAEAKWTINETTPSLSFDSLNGLEALHVNDFPIDLNTSKILPIKKLSYDNPGVTVQGWSSLSDTLTSLSVSGGNHLSSEPFEFFALGHDILDPAKLYKLKNIKRFCYNCKSVMFARCFASGMYDDAMPLIEDLHLSFHPDDGQMVSEEALCNYISKQKHLKSVEFSNGDLRVSTWKGRTSVVDELGNEIRPLMK